MICESSSVCLNSFELKYVPTAQFPLPEKIMMKACFRFKLFATLTTSVIAAGCTPAPTTPPPKANPAATAKTDHDHPHPHKSDGAHTHGAGPHEGTVADWGGGKYHVEFTVDHEKQEATVYVLGSDEKTPAPIKTADGKLLLTIKQPAFQVELISQPLDGESDDKSSRFVGKNEKLGVVQEFAGTISGEVEGTPYAGDFKEEPHGHEDK
jgi:hypothetical protein